MSNRKRAGETLLTRQQLHEPVWSEPIVSIMPRLGVSNFEIARTCDYMEVPRPAAGHWMKATYGQTPPTVPLPAPAPHTPLVWNVGEPLRKPKPGSIWAPEAHEDEDTDR